ncbi:hypothetical protein ACJIZ3_025015 [Penstemon smallii]|uniref:Uncharacterized protein n=1 Tax=Penstemon smallii TaxID=265156 RepID=A0ABD3TTI0_9LAMI
MILEPIKHVFPFNFPILAELCSDLFDLLGVRGAHSTPVQHFQDSYLFLRWIPPRPPRSNETLEIKTAISGGGIFGGGGGQFRG